MEIERISWLNLRLPKNFVRQRGKEDIKAVNLVSSCYADTRHPNLTLWACKSG